MLADPLLSDSDDPPARVLLLASLKPLVPDMPCGFVSQSLIDFQRSPTDEGEVRLLYHRVVAPTKGIFGWAGGESLTFDLVFTGGESMAVSDILNLVKASQATSGAERLSCLSRPVTHAALPRMVT